MRARDDAERAATGALAIPLHPSQIPQSAIRSYLAVNNGPSHQNKMSPQVPPRLEGTQQTYGMRRRQEARKTWAGLTADEKMLARRWQPARSPSFQDIVMTEWSWCGVQRDHLSFCLRWRETSKCVWVREEVEDEDEGVG